MPSEACFPRGVGTLGAETAAIGVSRRHDTMVPETVPLPFPLSVSLSLSGALAQFLVTQITGKRIARSSG